MSFEDFISYNYAIKNRLTIRCTINLTHKITIEFGKGLESC